MIIRFKFILKKYRGVRNKIQNTIRSIFTMNSIIMDPINNGNLNMKAKDIIYNILQVSNRCNGFF